MSPTGFGTDVRHRCREELDKSEGLDEKQKSVVAAEQLAKAPAGFARWGWGPFHPSFFGAALSSAFSSENVLQAPEAWKRVAWTRSVPRRNGTIKIFIRNVSSMV